MLAPSRSPKENFYIGSLPGIVDGRELRRFLQQFGEVTSLEVIKDAGTGKCKGYAFLCVNLYISEERFLNMSHIYDGRFIFIRLKLQGNDLKVHKEDFQHKRLYVSTTSRRLRDQDLDRYFSQFGEVELAYFVRNHNKEHDKVTFGYVNFKNCESVNLVLARSKHFINHQEVKCDVFRPKKQSEGNAGNTQLPAKLQVINKRKPVKQQYSSTHGGILYKQNTTESGPIHDDKSELWFRPTSERVISDLLKVSSVIQGRHYDSNIRINMRRPSGL
jgi:RNA recognition motif-containing protein